MNSSFTRSLFTLLPILALGFAITSEAEARTINVNCPSKSLQSAVERAGPGDTINVSGDCFERITVGTDGVTIDGGGTASIDGNSLVGAQSLVVVEARNVRIQNITVTNSPGSGIDVRSNGSAIIEGTTVTLSARHGIKVSMSAYARIGSDLDHPAAGTGTGNVISDNAQVLVNGSGIFVQGSANADIFHNLVTGNSRGININNAGSADIDGNKITGNTARGLSLLTSGAVVLGLDFVHGHNNLIELNGIGIRCRLGGAADGNLQNFGVGNPGTGDTPHSDDTDITGSCHVTSAIFTP